MQKFYVLFIQPLSVLYGSQNKQRVLSYKILTHWFCITEMESVYSAVRTESLYKTESCRLYKGLTTAFRNLPWQIQEEIEKNGIKEWKTTDKKNETMTNTITFLAISLPSKICYIIRYKEEHYYFGNTQNSPACPCGNSSINAKMTMEYWWNVMNGKKPTYPIRRTSVRSTFTVTNLTTRVSEVTDIHHTPK
jgi:hypothetical protein